MTLILALRCADGIVLASDGQGTSDGSGQETVISGFQKIHCQWTSIAWGASGAAGTMQLVQQAFKKHDPRRYDKPPSAFWVRTDLVKEIAKPIRDLMLNVVINLPNQTSPVCTFLLAGYAAGEPLIVEVTPTLGHEDHAERGFAAIGSGEIFPRFALASVSHFNIHERTILEAKLVAYRVLQDSISVAPRWLGPPIQMIEITKPTEGTNGVARQLDDDELLMIRDKLAEWKLAESEALSTLVGINPAPA